MIFNKTIIVIIGSIMFMIILIVARYNMSLRELAENKMIFDDELEQVLIEDNIVRFPKQGLGWVNQGAIPKV